MRSVLAGMSSSTCSARGANTYECHWNYDHGVKSDPSVKANVRTRRKREFTPDEQKDDNYWMKRSRNNEAAKRSRERRRIEERLLEERALHLLRENEKLKAALSAVSYPGVAKETSYDTFVDYSPVRGLSQDSCIRTLVNFPGSHRTPHYALSSRHFSSAHDSVPLPSMQNFPSTSFPSVDTKHQRDRSLGLSNRHVPYSSLSYENAQSKWGQGQAYPMINLHSNPARFSLTEMVPGCQCPAGSLPNSSAHTLTVETHADERSVATEPENLCKAAEEKEPARVLTSPLLPHKLRYKVNRARALNTRDFKASSGINM